MQPPKSPHAFKNLSPEERDRIICDFIEWYLYSHHYAPSVREIGKYLGLRSSSSVKEHLDMARIRGRVTWMQGQNRTITVVYSS